MEIIKKREKFIRLVKNLGRKIKFLNEFENVDITNELQRKIIAIKEHNSQIVFNTCYMPLAMQKILKQDGYLTNGPQAVALATSMMLKDVSDGVLTEFYKFKEVSNDQ